MDSPQELVADRSPEAPSRNLARIKHAWAVFDEAGAEASMEVLMGFARPDVESRPYAAEGVVLRGESEIRAFFARSADDGTRIEARAQSFEETNDSVIVSGSIRLVHGDGSFAETKVRWHYDFTDGLLSSMGWEPRAGD
jgi:hypothetical protein